MMDRGGGGGAGVGGTAGTAGQHREERERQRHVYENMKETRARLESE